MVLKMNKIKLVGLGALIGLVGLSLGYYSRNYDLKIEKKVQEKVISEKLQEDDNKPKITEHIEEVAKEKQEMKAREEIEKEAKRIFEKNKVAEILSESTRREQ